MIDDWIRQLIDRHTRVFTRAEFLRSVRALSARYVERRSELPDRPPLDSPGKRAAFAGFYAPLHLLTAHAIGHALGPPSHLPLETIDLGCGTGAASAGWALAATERPKLVGIDRLSWPLGEAAWNWTTLGLSGETRRGDLVGTAARMVHDQIRDRRPSRPIARHVMLGWTVNELDPDSRRRLLESLLAMAASGSSALVIEPLARRATPWWEEWRDALAPFGVRSDEWRFEITLPAVLAELDREAGFRREGLTAKSLWIAPRPALDEV